MKLYTVVEYSGQDRAKEVKTGTWTEVIDFIDRTYNDAERGNFGADHPDFMDIGIRGENADGTYEYV